MIKMLNDYKKIIQSCFASLNIFWFDLFKHLKIHETHLKYCTLSLSLFMTIKHFFLPTLINVVVKTVLFI